MGDRRGRTLDLSSIARAAGAVIVLTALFVILLRYRNISEEYSLYRVERLIRASQSQGRNTLGRLSSAPYAPLNPERRAGDDLGQAQVLLLALPDSERNEYLQSLINIGTKNWNSAIEKLSKLAAEPDA